MQIKVDIPRWLGKLKSAEAYRNKDYTAYTIFHEDGDLILTDSYSMFYFTEKDISEILQLKEKYYASQEREKHAFTYPFQKIPREAFKSEYWELEGDELIYGNSRTQMERIHTPNVWGVFYPLEKAKQCLLGVNAWTDDQIEGGIIVKAPLAGILAVDGTDIEVASQGIIVLPMLMKILPAMWKEGWYLGRAYFRSKHLPVIVEMLRDVEERAGWLLVMPSKE